jgi:hypothetical protein
MAPASDSDPLLDLIGAPEAPPAEQRAELLAILGELCAGGGGERFLRPPVTPGVEAFPEPWEATPLAVATVLRRLIAHAAMDMDVQVADRRVEAGPAPRRHTTELELVELRGPRARFDLFAIGDDDVAGTLAHEIGVAAAMRLGQPAGPYRDAGVAAPDDGERLRGSVAAVYLGLGVLAANATFQEYLGGSYKAHLGYAPIEHDIIRAGHLAMDAVAFLVAVQAEVRDSDLPRGLRGPQKDAARAWRTALAGRGAALRAFLGIAEARAAPARFERPAPAPLPELTAAQLVIEAAPDPPHKVFRVRYSSAGVGMLTGMLVGGATATFAALPLWLVAAATGGAALLGFVLGGRRQIFRCSECLTVVPEPAERCARCGGLLAGEVATRADRLDHDEDGEP